MHIASVFVFKFFVFANKNDTRKQRFLQYKYLNLFNIFALLDHRFQHPLMVCYHFHKFQSTHLIFDIIGDIHFLHYHHDSIDRSIRELNPRSIDLLPTTQQFLNNGLFFSLFRPFNFKFDSTGLSQKQIEKVFVAFDFTFQSINDLFHEISIFMGKCIF